MVGARMNARQPNGVLFPRLPFALGEGRMLQAKKNVLVILMEGLTSKTLNVLADESTRLQLSKNGGVGREHVALICLGASKAT